MSELLGLGLADGESRWIGVRRHQAVLVIVGLGFIGEWILHAHAASIEIVIGVALLVCAVPTNDGLTVGERVRIAVEFIVRPRWTSIRATSNGADLTISAHGEVKVRGYELQHRGRLDLSGRDQLNATALIDFADALATTNDTRHFSVHVRRSLDRVTTLLAVPSDASAPSGWTENVALALECAGTGGRNASVWLLERWAYVRDASEVIHVLRVWDFSAVPEGHAFLERVQFASPSLDVVVHVDVVGGVRAQRVAARAVHRVGSDDLTSQAAGFRRTAQSTRTLERLRQRERLVVNGTSLLKVAVFVVIRSTSLVGLRHDVKAVTRSALEAGLRCEAGFGRQASWYCSQLPGGPGW